MLVAVRALEVLTLFGVIGFPISTLLLSQSVSPSSGVRVSLSLLVAPATGLMIVGMTTAMSFAVGRPMLDAVGPIWLLVALAWSALIVLRRRGLGGLRGLWRAIGVRVTPGHFVIGMALLIGMGIYFVPFVRNGRLVFWHFAGTDGYFYMRVAEYLQSYTATPLPNVGIYDAASGFLREMLKNIGVLGIVERPGTFGTLAGTAGILGLLPQEAYSPLVIAAMGMYFLSLVALGLSLGLRPPIASALGLVGVASPVAWMLGTETFLGNLLIMSLLPLLIVLPVGAMPITRAVYMGLVLGAITWLFPDISVAAVAICVPFALVLMTRAIRLRMLRPYLLSVVVVLATGVLVILPLIGPLTNLAIMRLGFVVGSTPGDAAAPAQASFQPLTTWDWVWPAFNLGGIPPVPLEPDEQKYFVALVVAIALFVVLSAWRRRVDALWCVVSCLTLVAVVGGLGGRFRGDYEMFRALAIFSFVPLAALFAVPSLVPWQRRRVAPLLAWVGVAFVLSAFARADFAQFQLAYQTYLPDIQYSTQSLRDRVAIQQLAQQHTITMATDTPSFTAFSNTIVLFSSMPLGIPSPYYKFVFISPGVPDPHQQYASDLVLRNLRYADIVQKPANALYQSDEFAVFDNDLVPFFDDDTFGPSTVLPASLLFANHLSPERMLTASSDVYFFSRSERVLRIALHIAGDKRPPTFRVAIDDNPSVSLPVESDGRVVTAPFNAAIGLHKLTLTPDAGQKLRVSEFAFEK